MINNEKVPVIQSDYLKNSLIEGLKNKGYKLPRRHPPTLENYGGTG